MLYCYQLRNKEDKTMKTKKQRLEQQLKNAVKSGNKAKAAWVIVELERIENFTENKEMKIEKNQELVVLNADKNLEFGKHTVEALTQKAFKIAGQWIPLRAIIGGEFNGQQAIRFRHWFEQITPPEVFVALDINNAKETLQIDKTKQAKIETPVLIQKLNDGRERKVFFIKVSETLTRVRKYEGIDYVALKNYDYLIGRNLAIKQYNDFLAKGFTKSMTRFADY
jgi:hypothetical protein